MVVALAPHYTLVPQLSQFTRQVQHIVLYAAKYMDTATTDKYNLHNKKYGMNYFLQLQGKPPVRHVLALEL